ncbi:zinc finger and BTB domain-containing protein 7C-like [Polyodon spathula]|uniref:zinc finger and BTB domain-containing protein 7C-like n=1 Tax=Polyodon spathula TaxID=7913 RepID=UPI001B7F483F|nr:zinc finger and BTB domain-containing protein 7C-like [Polyodon spathula]XP_041103455.1 zinc finger and BTB domain-containing protein 7C-like [Polyodon spathula]XP_041103464.1 zinc finger and BTB domain-containing protein 7C-like [Polyodon spathula]XP_041103473.1 zinc finger and BTB domain-containing protein 7C-like [Polyodon spathula]XP_041103483.1 zinc finger and BTB domain-containing protein 7C-like [Polyodon spathula]XP_041103492.1 zinc finger and BTB domain-containing protein 7C-like [
MAIGDDDLIGIPFPNHSSEVLCSLNEQRHDGLLCDVILIVKDQEYRTHRSVLAACSQYFKKLFTVSTAGEQHSVYEIDFVTPESLAAILEFAYTSTLTITTANVKDILSAAQMLEIQCVINVCLEIMDINREADEEGEAEEEKEDEEEKEEDNAMEASEKKEPQEASNIQDCPPSTLKPEHTEGLFSETPRDSESVKQFTERRKESESLEGGTSGPLRNFSIESLLQEGLYPKLTTQDRMLTFSPLIPSFLPPMWAGEFPGLPQILHHHHNHQEVENRPLDLVIKKENIKEELKEDHPASGFPSDFLKDIMGIGARSQLGHIKEETDFSSYLNFLGASHLGGLFPPWQLEEERKMKPKASQQCPICNKVIQGAGKLPRHMRTHTGEKPYMCNICEVRFTRQDKLKIHMRKHTGERPYICIHCNSRFVHNYDLKNHLRIHTGMRPYQCEHCYKSFTRSDHLHRHIKRQSCRVSRPRRGRKPAACRSASSLYAQSSHHNDRPLQQEQQAGGRHLPLTLGMDIAVSGDKHFLEERCHSSSSRNGLSFSVEDLDNSIESSAVKLSERKHLLEAERNRGVFTFALAHEDSLPHRPFFSAGDPWGIRLGHTSSIPEASN